MKNNLVITVILVVFVGGAAFFGGMKYQQSQLTTMQGQGTRGQGFGSGRFGGRGGATFGKVVAQDANSLTVQLQDGSSKIVDVSSTTQFMKSASASAADVKTGDTVMVMGATNSDGSVSAQNVQINPIFRHPRPSRAMQPNQ